MEKLCKDLQLVYDDENVIGKTKDIIEMMYRIIKNCAENVEDYTESLITIQNYTDFIEVLLNEIENYQLRMTDIIRIYENPMGGFNYEGV